MLAVFRGTTEVQELLSSIFRVDDNDERPVGCEICATRRPVRLLYENKWSAAPTASCKYINYLSSVPDHSLLSAHTGPRKLL